MKYLKHFLLAAAFSSSFATSASAEVGVSVTVGEPGFYGRIDIGGYPQPRVIYSQPRVVYRESVYREPIYMRVPPGHAKNWRKHCRHYNACQERVYFVQDNWYHDEYAPRYQEQHRDEHHDEYNRDNGRNDRGDNRETDEHNSRGYGHENNRNNNGRDHNRH